LTLVRGDGDSPVPPLSAYRSTVVELPWRDFLGRTVLLAIDAEGCIRDQRVAVSEVEAQRITDEMMEALG
jgi:hypothetical protein